jgi:hypothetical protein
MPDGLTEGNEGNKVQTLGGIVLSGSLQRFLERKPPLPHFFLLKIRLPLNQLNRRVDRHLTQSD